MVKKPIMNPLHVFTDAIKETIADQKEEVSGPKPGQTRAEFLREEIWRLRKRRERLARLSRLYIAVGTICTVSGVVLYFTHSQKEAVILLGYGALFMLWPAMRSARSFDTDILALEGELDLVTTVEVSVEQRAEKLFKQHQFELQKYYNQTLQHSKWIFVVGVFCIFVGFAIIATTFWLVTKPHGDTAFQEKVLVSALGAVGGVLANFIAVIYLRMFSEILKSVTDFHNRLVATHNLYFANFMVTKVAEGAARDGLVTEIAKNLTKS